MTQPSQLGITRNVSDTDLALCRAALYSAMALGFRPPTDETRERLVSEEGARALAEAAGALGSPNAAGICAAALRLSAAETSLPTLSDAYLRLFGHTARGRVPPYETEYGAEALFQQPQELGDLGGFYSAFGLSMNPAIHERADHVSCECEFLSFLALKEAYALESGDTAMLEETRKAARLFLRDHLARFVPAFARKLITEGKGTFYEALGELCLSFVTDECAWQGVTLGPGNLGLRPGSDDRVPMACGSGADCAAMPGACEPE